MILARIALASHAVPHAITQYSFLLPASAPSLWSAVSADFAQQYRSPFVPADRLVHVLHDRKMYMSAACDQIFFLLKFLKQKQKHLIIRTAVHEMLPHQLAYGIAQTVGFWQLFEYFILEFECFHEDPFYIYTLSISFIGFCGSPVI